MRRWAQRRALFLAVLILLCPRGSHAYTGGPTLARVLGYDSIEKKVFYSISFQDESGNPDRYYFFAIGDSQGRRPVRSRFFERDTTACRRLLERLHPLASLDSTQAFVAVTILAKSRVTLMCAQDRFHLRINAVSGGMRTTAKAWAYCRPTARAMSVYRIPGRQERLIVLRFTGHPYCCEAVEAPILVAPGTTSEIVKIEEPL